MENIKFKEAFYSLNLDNDLDFYMEDVSILKITKDSSNSVIRIYTLSKALIPKSIIISVEQALYKQVFKKHFKRVRILDRYKLNESFDKEVIFKEYKESIELELETYFIKEYQIYKDSDIFFDNNVLKIIMPKGVFTDLFGDNLIEYFKNLYSNRFFMECAITYDYKETLTGQYKIEQHNRLKEKIENILKNTENENVKKEVVKKEKEVIKKESTKKEVKEDTNLLYGRNFDDEIIEISKIDDNIHTATIYGMIRNVDFRQIKNEKVLYKFDVTDFNDTISVSLFIENDALDEIKNALSNNTFIKLKGQVQFNKFEQDVVISRVYGIKKATDNRVIRSDSATKKRVELHCHTKMSDMDGISYAKDYIRLAKSFNHAGIAITDHGVVQAFPECGKEVKKDDDFQVIYGMEAYIINDDQNLVKAPDNVDIKERIIYEDSFVVFDFETTGFSALHNKIIEIGATKIVSGKIVDQFSSFVNPHIPIPFKISKLTGITDFDVKDARSIEEVLPEFIDFIGDAILVAHNADFDISFLLAKSKEIGINKKYIYLDTVSLSQFIYPGLSNYKLDTLVKHTNIVLENHHRAVDDARATAHLLICLFEEFKKRDIYSLDELNKQGEIPKNVLVKKHPYHCILLAKTEEGKNNLYRLVSASHIEYFYRVPKIPKTLLNKYRNGLIVGSACSEGELYEAILSGRSDEILANIVNFYDYLEIQPIKNNQYLIEDENSYIKDEDDLKNVNKKIVELGKEFNKMVVATGDVHFLNPEDSIYRTIVQNDKGFKDASNQPPLYLKTTDEMLDEFSYLGEKTAFEVVVTNPNKILLQCEKISPVRPDKCPPIIQDSDKLLRDICYKKAYEIYGENLPELVLNRLEKELNSIISNGYSVMYIIAQKLVSKSNDDGFLVGSRGSVGSSFAATMAGITEVNPLPPHYLCSNCHYVDFDSSEVKKHSGGAGCDMPDATCPKCNTKLDKLGFDIPFETFLGFKGNKEPDIDLNFSNIYQSKAHAYTEVIFGKGQTFKAGTIGTIADKTAFGLAYKYFKGICEEKNIPFTKRRCELVRIAEGCVDIRRTTGQHPGGIVVLPIGEDINTFTPVQRPANDMKTDIITTHFDYHSIDHNLLKLDILGHLDPTMIRALQDLTKKDPLLIPFDCKEVMSLFQSTEILNIKPEQIGGTTLGTLGVPEFGTDFAIEMLKEAKPTKFSDLVRIAGLAHGTDVWLGNTQELLKNNVATISTAICTRDDIMTYLILCGLENELSFNIMEAVRKGKGLKEEWEEAMKNVGVPDWYIWSCNKIKYMFPKAHAAAYVMMAWRIAYCKIFYPIEYYTAYFSIRAKAFDYEKMAMGKDKLSYFISDYRKRNESKSLSAAEEEELKDMRIVEEMYARGFEFCPIDIYKASARDFKIIDNKIMPSFRVIDKVGDVAGESIEAVADINSPFLSKEDLMKRAKIGQSVIEKLSSLHILDDMTDTNQLTLFDFT